jgi:tetratricopeptide (TPR) repeat protein
LEKQDTVLGLKRIYAKVAAENADDLVYRNHALLELGILYFEKCDFMNAVDCLEKVKTEALQFHLYDNYFLSVTYLYRIHTERLTFDKTESLVREVQQVGASLEQFKRYAPKIHYNSGIAAAYQKNFAEAQKQFDLSERLALEVIRDESLTEKERADVRRDLLRARYGKAVDLKDKGKHEAALAAFEKLNQEIQDFSHQENLNDHFSLHDLEASVLMMEGRCYLEMRQYQKALDKYWAAHSLLKSHRNWSFYYYVLYGLGKIYLSMDDTAKATIFFDLITDAIGNLELNALKRGLQRMNKVVEQQSLKLMIDRERKVVIEKTMGEIHFDRRFVLLEILYLVASEPGKIFTKEDLVSNIWRESYNPMVHDSKVYTSISRLRKLIEPDFKRPRYILNERDGYAFNPNVQLEEVGASSRKPTYAVSVHANSGLKVERGIHV